MNWLSFLYGTIYGAGMTFLVWWVLSYLADRSRGRR